MSYDNEEALYDHYLSEVYQEAHETKIIEQSVDNAISELPSDKIRYYLATYGDAIEKRIKTCLSEASELIKNKHYSPALVQAVTSIEIIIRYFILRPLVEGAFLSDEIAIMLMRRIFPGQTVRDREILPAITKHYGIPLMDLSLSNGNKLWDILTNNIFPKRNYVVHKADKVDVEDPLIAIECANKLLNEVVTNIAKKYFLDWPKTGVWHKIDSINRTEGRLTKVYEPMDPFK